MSTHSSSPVVSVTHSSLRRYSEEFKLKAVRMVLEQKHSIQQVARTLECAPMSVRHWVTRFQERGDQGQSPPFIASEDVGKCRSNVTRKTKKSSPVFLPVRLIDELTESPRGGNGYYEIVTQSGLTLRLSNETALDVLVGLVRQLESVPC